MATKQQISKCLCDTLEKARVFLGAGVGIDTEGAKPDKSNIDNFLEQARQRASLRLEKGFWNAERNRRKMYESIGSARVSLAQDIANAKPPKKEVERRHERIMPKWDNLPNCVKVISEEVFGNCAIDNRALALIRSMLPRYAEATVCYIKGRRHSNTLEVAPIIDRIKHRRKIAELHGQTLAIFANDRIDESTKADDLALLAAFCNGKTQTAQGNSKSDKRERAPGVTNKWIAQQFNNYALPLIAKCYPINKEGDEERIRRDIIPTLQKQGRKFAMNKEYGGLCVYEKMRGGNKSGYATVGSITERQIKTWIKAYPDESNPEPKSGFHAGMLKDKASIEEAAKKWGDYTRRYALAFFEWRKTHTGTPRNQFRYSPSPIIHGAEHTAASARRS